MSNERMLRAEEHLRKAARLLDEVAKIPVNISPEDMVILIEEYKELGYDYNDVIDFADKDAA